MDKMLEEESPSGNRGESDEEETFSKRRCVNPFSSDDSKDSCPVEVLVGVWFPCGGFGVLSVCWSVESFGVLLVLVLPWRMGDLDVDLSLVSDYELVVSQSFSFFRKRRVYLMTSQGGMNMAGTPADVRLLSKGRIQEVDCGAAKRTACTSRLKKRDAELEYHVLAPNEPTGDIERIVMKARGEKNQRLSQVFSRQGAK